MRQRLDDADDKLPLAWQLIVQYMGNVRVDLDKVTRCSSNLDTAELAWNGCGQSKRARFQES